MNRVVAVENNLDPIRDYLSAQGCQIIAVETVKDNKVDAVVLSGMDQNIMGIQDIATKAPVINASGLSPEEVWNQIKSRTMM